MASTINEELTRYTDDQSAEHQEGRAARELAERLTARLLENKDDFIRRLLLMLKTDFNINWWQLNYKGGRKGRHGAAGRVQAAFIILESMTFHLVDNWRPGRSVRIDSETLESSGRSYNVFARFDPFCGNLLLVQCECVDSRAYEMLLSNAAPKNACKHCLCYVLLALAYRDLHGVSVNRGCAGGVGVGSDKEDLFGTDLRL